MQGGRASMRNIATITRDILADWKNPYFGAVPYLRAMLALETMSDQYGHDDADMILRYFLSNATTWRGETARRIKAELKAGL